MAGYIVTGGAGALGRRGGPRAPRGRGLGGRPYREERGLAGLRERWRRARVERRPVDPADVATARFVEEAAARLGDLTGCAIAGAYAGSGPCRMRQPTNGRA
jgi:hypothetical protein